MTKSHPVIEQPIVPPFLAFMKDNDCREAAREVASRNGWSEGCVQYGDVRQAVLYLQEQACPKTLLVEIPSAEEAPEMLDRLANVCTPEMRVLVTGDVDEYSFFTWLQSIGIQQYLLKPFTAEMLQQAIEPELSEEDIVTRDESEGKLIAFVGARGGVGTTTIATNSAHLIANEYKQQTAMLDMDPYFGTAAMAFDIQPGHGLRDALEKPDRIDDLFLERVMVRHSKRLSVLGGEEAFKETVAASATAADTLIAQLRKDNDYVLVDVPRTATPLTRSILTQADQIIIVCELSLLSLRDVLRLRDYIRETLRKPEPTVVANREGLASKYELSKQQFEEHYSRPVDIHVPCMMEAFAATSTGEMLVQTSKNTTGLQALHDLADNILGIEQKNISSKPHGLMATIMGVQQHVWKTRH